jgi:hypothetical protein
VIALVIVYCIHGKIEAEEEKLAPVLIIDEPVPDAPTFGDPQPAQSAEGGSSAANPLAGVNVREYIRLLSKMKSSTRIEKALEQLAGKKDIVLNKNDKNEICTAIKGIVNRKCGQKPRTLKNLRTAYESKFPMIEFNCCECSQQAFPILVAALALISNFRIVVGVDCVNSRCYCSLWQFHDTKLFRFKDGTTGSCYHYSIFNYSDSKLSPEDCWIFSKKIGTAPEDTYISHYESNRHFSRFILPRTLRPRPYPGLPPYPSGIFE